jgi:hypothetical protein
MQVRIEFRLFLRKVSQGKNAEVDAKYILSASGKPPPAAYGEEIFDYCSQSYQLTRAYR